MQVGAMYYSAKIHHLTLVYLKPNIIALINLIRLIWQRFVWTCCLLRHLHSCLWQCSCKCLSYQKIMLVLEAPASCYAHLCTIFSSFLQARHQSIAMTLLICTESQRFTSGLS